MTTYNDLWLKSPFPVKHKSIKFVWKARKWEKVESKDPITGEKITLLIELK
jgi:hypothetical protein